MESCENLINLVGHFAWPLTVVFACLLFYTPLSKLLETISKRATKFSAFKVDIELGRLSAGRALSTEVAGLKKIVVAASGPQQIVLGALQSGSADYVSVDLGKDKYDEWLTSRLFLLAAILERSPVVRCLVFLSGERFLGAATPRDVRAGLGAHYLTYESALASASCRLGGADETAFRGGLTDKVANELSTGFLSNQRIVLYAAPMPPAPASQVLLPGWLKLERQNGPTSWEFADWLTPGTLRNMVGDGYMMGTVVASVGKANSEVTKSIVNARGAFVALIDQRGAFIDLCDRLAILDSVARQAAEQTSE